MKDHYYILMADIVRSSSFEGRGEELMEDFKTTVARVNDEQSQDILSPLTITLGDEFQGIGKDLPAAIRLLISVEETRIKTGADFQLRYVIYYGEIETPINTKTAHEMLGKGLSSARELLNSMKSDKYSRCKIKLAQTDFELALNNALVLFFGITTKWKTDDYPLIAAFLDGNNYKAAAEKTGRERTSTLRKQRTLRIKEYFVCKALIETLSGTKPC